MAEDGARIARDRLNNLTTSDESKVAEWQTIVREARDRLNNLTTSNEPEVAEWQTMERIARDRLYKSDHI